MNYIYKKALIVLALVSFGGSLFGWDWYFHNQTKVPLMISMDMTGSMNQVFWYLVYPGKQASFEWRFPYCYDTIKVVEYDRFRASQFNRRLGNLKEGAYGSNSKPKCTSEEEKNPEASPCAASAQEVQEYFRRLSWHTPMIIFPKTPIDYIDATKAAKESPNKVLEFLKEKGLDFGTQNLMESWIKLVFEAITKGKCINMTLDIFEEKDAQVPGSNLREDTYIFVKRPPGWVK